MWIIITLAILVLIFPTILLISVLIDFFDDAYGRSRTKFKKKLVKKFDKQKSKMSYPIIYDYEEVIDLMPMASDKLKSLKLWDLGYKLSIVDPDGDPKFRIEVLDLANLDKIMTSYDIDLKTYQGKYFNTKIPSFAKYDFSRLMIEIKDFGDKTHSEMNTKYPEKNIAEIGTVFKLD